MIGITEDGYPIVTGEYSCPNWEAGAGGTFEMRECWYCKYADFRKTTQIVLEKSICHCPSYHITPGLKGQKKK
ncbi:hypothetical protein [Hydrogenoanaerobacterium saccharovorans]|nr:hypothetical protein [Hydrogenoanaerobacterium saccharovorans]